MPSRSYRRAVTLLGGTGRYSDYGDAGADVAVVVGSPVAAMSVYEPTGRALAAEGYRVVLVELPGGLSTARLPEGWDFARLAGWVIAFMDRVGLAKAALIVGHSNSGPVVMRMAADHPSRIGRVVMMGSIGAEPLGSLLRMMVGYALSLAYEGTFPLRAGPVLIGNAVKQTRALWHQRGLALTGQEEEAAAVARRVGAPTLIVWGRHDHVAGARAAEEFAAWIPNAQVYCVDDGGHDWLVVEARAFARAVAAWARGGGVGRDVPCE
ncbi:MAG: alpha/beta fold hydrolase [Phycisphaerae bacterium]